MPAPAAKHSHDSQAGAITIQEYSPSSEDFVRWLRSQTRTRNGATKGKRAVYAVGGVKFILSTCRTAFN